MMESEAHELVSVLLRRYPNFPIESEPQWVQSFQLVDCDTAFKAVSHWCETRAQWPTIAELHEVVARMTRGYAHGRSIMWQAYTRECERQGKEPTAEFLAPTG